jgi:hypothetical protein
LDWSWEETFSKFENVLSGSYKTAWREVLADNSTDLDALDEQNNCRFDHDEVGFRRAVGLFVCKILNSEMPQDLQYVYMVPGGDHKIVKDLLTPLHENARQFKEMLRIAKLLPAGKTPMPSEKLALQWYYMTYHRADRAEYVKSGKSWPPRQSKVS